MRKLILFILCIFSSGAQAMEVARAQLEKNENTYSIWLKDQKDAQGKPLILGTAEIVLSHDGRVVRAENGIAVTMHVKIQLESAQLVGGRTPQRIGYLPEWAIVPQEVPLVLKEGAYEGEAEILIPVLWLEQKKNEEFTTAMMLTFPEEGEIFKEGVIPEFEPILVRFTPKIDLSVDKRVVDFGTLAYEGGRVKSSAKERVVLGYAILTDAGVSITSRNGGFRLKRTGDSEVFIEYQVNAREIRQLEPNTKYVPLLAEEGSFYLDFEVDAPYDRAPMAGDYQDTVVVEICSKR
ncbi:MAG: hypothetical protein LBF76_02240 [Holosporales bacterium]|jgi:hypothetical protein|nr:hypothetical protein [Holosporales bacterium]